MNRDRVSLTEGSIWKNMLLFTLPIFLGNVFQQLYNTVDAWVVGRYLGTASLAAVTSTGSLIFMLIGFFGGTATGAGVVISRHYGAKDHASLKKAVHTNLAFAITAGLLMTAIGIIFAPGILRIMDTPEEVLEQSVSYIRLYFAGSVFIVLYNISMGILRAVGDSKSPLVYLGISSAINVALDLLFVGVFKWGVWSAAVATTISQGVSTVLCLLRLIRRDTVYKVSIKDIRFDKDTLLDIIRLGLPSGVQNCMIAFANVVVQSNINHFGPDAMAGSGSYAKVEGFAFLPITCFSMALSTFVGQNLGAKQYDRVKQGVRFGIVCSVLIAETIGVLIFFFGGQFVSFFDDNPDVMAFGARQSRVEALTYFLLAFSHCIAGVMRGAGKAIVPMITMFASWCALRVTYITLMIRQFDRIEVVYTAYPLTWFVSSVIFLIYFMKADWIHGLDHMHHRSAKEISPPVSE